MRDNESSRSFLFGVALALAASCGGEREPETPVAAAPSALTDGPRAVGGKRVPSSLVATRALAELAASGRRPDGVRRSSPAHQGQFPPLPFRAVKAAPVPMTTAAAVPSPGPAATFIATGDTGWTPPDTNGAVGPSHLVVAVNGAVVVQSRTGTELSRVGLNDFFASVSHGTHFVFDPMALYDPIAGRFMIVSQAHNTGAGAIDSGLLIAVSQSSDPTRNWHFYRFDIDPANSVAWGDFPKIGFNRRWIIATTNVIDSPDQGSMILACDKMVLYAGLPATCTRFDTWVFAASPAVTYDSFLDVQFLGHNEAPWQGKVALDTITGPIGDETLTLGAVLVDMPASWGDFRFVGPQAGTTLRELDTGFSWVNALIYRNGSLWGAQLAGVQMPSSHTTVQWWQVSPTGILQQFGRIEDTTGNRFFVYPSLAVNKNNDVLVGYSRFAPDQFPSANYAFRAGSDPLNSMRDDRVFRAGESAYCPDCEDVRWGDYSITTVDPTNDLDMWTIQEYAATGGWGTAWAKVVPPAPVTVTAAADAYVRDGSGASTNFGTAANLYVQTQSGTGNNRITYVRFPLASVPASVTGARLRLFGIRQTASAATDSAFAVSSNSWSETGITYNNRPALGTRLGAPVTVENTQQYHEWDVSAFVKSQKAAGASAVSLAVRMDGASSGADAFSSRESTSNRPQLVVTTGGPPIDRPPTVARAATAVPNPTTSSQADLSVLGADDSGEGALSYFWSVAGQAPSWVSFTENDSNAAKNTTVFVSGPGTYNLKVAIRDARHQTAISTVTLVVNRTFTSIIVDPESITVAPRGTQQFTATAVDQFWTPMDPQPTFSWSVSGGGTISATGLFTAGSAEGSFTVTASAQGKTGTAAVRVRTPTTTTIAAVADAYVRDGSSAGANFGTATTLQVKSQAGTGNTRLTYLRFPVTSAVGGNVMSAKLRLYGSRPGSSTNTDSAFAVWDNQWSETGITFNSRPPLGSRQGSGVVVSNTAAYHEWDVTSFIRVAREEGEPEVSLAVQMDSDTSLGPDTFNAREASSNRPQLVVTSTPW